MGRKEQKERTKKIMADMQARRDLLAQYKKKYPEYGKLPEHAFSRIQFMYLDMSGTPEAEKKNMQFLMSLHTEEGRSVFFKKYLDDCLKIDPAVCYSTDPDVLLDFIEQNPSAFFAASDAPYVFSHSRSSATTMAQFVFNENIGTFQLPLSLEANLRVMSADYFDRVDFDRLTGTYEDIAYLKSIGLAAESPAILEYKVMMLDQQKKVEKVVRDFQAQGIDFSQAQYYRAYDADGKPMRIVDLLESIANGGKGRIEKLSEEEIQKIDEAVAHPELHSVHKQSFEKTDLPYEGVKGIGYTAVPTKDMEEKGGKASFFGGLEVSGAVKDELEAQPVSELLHFAPNPDGSFVMSYKFPERGRSEDGREFNIRTNINVLAKYCAKKFTDAERPLDAMKLSEVFSELSDAVGSMSRDGLSYEEKMEYANRFVDMLGMLPDDPAKHDLADFLSAYEGNMELTQMMLLNFSREAESLGVMQYVKDTKAGSDLQAYDFVMSNQEDYNNIILNYRKMAEMNPYTETEPMFGLNTGRGVIYSNMLNAVNRYRDPDGLHPENTLKFTVSDGVRNSVSSKIDPETQLQRQVEHYGYVAVTGIQLNGKESVLSLESPDTPVNKVLFCKEKRMGLGFYDSVQELEKTNANVVVFNPHEKMLFDLIGKPFGSEMQHVDSVLIDESGVYDFGRQPKTEAPERRSNYQIFSGAVSGADLFVKNVLAGKHPESTRKMVYDSVINSLLSDGYRALDPDRLNAMSYDERFEYLNSPETGISIAAMTMLSGHTEEIVQDMERLGSYDRNLIDRIRFSGELFKPLLETATLVSDPAAYMKDHPGRKNAYFEKLQNACSAANRALSSFAEITESLGGKRLSFADELGAPLNAADASQGLLEGQPFIVKKPGSTLECFAVNADGTLNKNYINPSSPELTDPSFGCRKIFAEISKALDSTDSLFLYTSSDTSDQIRRIVRNIGDPKKNLSGEQLKESLQKLDELSESYRQRKSDELSKNGKLNERSGKRLDLIERAGALAHALKDPEGYRREIAAKVSVKEELKASLPQ